MFRRKDNSNKPEWDPELEPLMKVLLGKKGIKTKSASMVGQKKVDYFRGKDFKKFLLGSEEHLKKKCSVTLKAMLEGRPPTTEKDVERLGAELLVKGFCYKAVYKPLNENKKQDSGSDKKPKKWPDRLQKDHKQSFDGDGYYVVLYEGGTGLRHFLLALIIVGVLLVCMFPVWPMWAKIGIWYLSVIFLTIYFGLLILRMVVYTLFWIVGFDFWIFPNINDEYCGFLDSFQPFYSWEKRKDDVLMLFVRFGSLAMVAVALEQIAQTHSLADVQDFVTSSYADVIDWGVEKLTALPGSDRAALPSLESLEAEQDNKTSNDTEATEGVHAGFAQDAAAAEDDDGDDVVDLDGGGSGAADPTSD